MLKRKTLHSNPVGLALSGGAARCLAQIGVLEVLDEAGIQIGAIAGTSAGSIIGALLASGTLDLQELRKLAITMKWRDMVKANIPRKGLISSEKIYHFVRRVINDMRFQDTKISLAVVASNLRNGEKTVITEGSVAKAVQASCSLPVIFTPTMINGDLLVDGGATSQLPTLTVKEELNRPFVIGVDVNFNAMEAARLDNMLQIAVHFVSLIARRNALMEKPFADIVIDVDAQGIFLIDLHKGKQLLRRGRQAAELKLDEIKTKIKKYQEQSEKENAQSCTH